MNRTNRAYIYTPSKHIHPTNLTPPPLVRISMNPSVLVCVLHLGGEKVLLKNFSFLL